MSGRRMRPGYDRSAESACRHAAQPRPTSATTKRHLVRPIYRYADLQPRLRIAGPATRIERIDRNGGALLVTNPPSTVTLTVHGIGTPVRPLDPGEDEVWVTVKQFEDVLDAVAGRADVRLTFDDANASDVEIALPHLVKRGLTAQFFLPAGLLGRPGRLTEDNVRELLDAGMTLGSHGW